MDHEQDEHDISKYTVREILKREHLDPIDPG
jgi:hypothetical protein